MSTFIEKVNDLAIRVGQEFNDLYATDNTFIRNQTSVTQTGGFKINGNGTLANLFSTDSITVGASTAPEASSIFSVVSTTKGSLLSRMSTTQRDAIPSPATGLLIFNTTTNKYEFFDGTIWSALGSGGITGLTLNTIPIATSSTTLGNSTITDAGTSYRFIKPYIVIQDTTAGLQFWKDGTPSKAAQIGFNNLSPDGLTFEIYDGTSWGTALSMTGNRSIGIGTNTTNASSILDITSTTKGTLLPRMTTTQQNAISSPATGLSIYNTTLNQNSIFNGSVWMQHWGTRGNDVVSGDFIGTTNAQDLIFKVNSTRAGIVSLLANGQTSLGLNTLALNTGTYNTAIGLNALSGTGAGSQNTAFGASSMIGLTNGSNNTAIGVASFYSLTTQQGNVGLGYYSGLQTTGSFNTFIGSETGTYSVTGSYNTLLGYQAGGDSSSYMSGGSYNLALGYKSQLPNNANSNQLSIANMIFGVGLTGTAASPAGQIGIGVATPNISSVLDITSTTKGVLIPRMDTTQQNAISTPATGLLIFNTTLNELRFYNGTAWSSVGSGATGWGFSGNAITTGQFLGTTNTEPLILKFNNLQVAKFSSNSALALSEGAVAGVAAVAIGYNTNAALNAVAIGRESKAVDLSVSLGHYAGSTQTSGSNNIAIGYNQVLASTTGSNQLNIGGSIFGIGLTGNVSSPAGQIGINTSAPDASSVLDVTSITKGVLIPRMTTTQQNAISSPATGLSIFNTTLNLNSTYNGTVWTQSWGTRGNSIVSGDFIGTTNSQALVIKQNSTNVGFIDTSVSYRLAFGANSGLLNTSNYNTIYGHFGLVNTGSGGANALFGSFAGEKISSGDGNNLFGHEAGKELTNASWNIAMGYQALRSSAGSYNHNVALGYQSQYSGAGSGNIAIGNSTLRGVSGNYNVAIGFGSGYASTSGSYNVLSGYGSGNALTTGNYNVGIGSDSLLALTTGSTNIAIGYNQNVASNTGSNQMNIGGAIFGIGLTGNVSSPAGQIGILTNAPSAGYALHVNGDIKGTKINIGLSNTLSGSSTSVIGDTCSVTGGSSYSYIMGGYSNTINGGYISSISGGSSNSISGTNNNIAATQTANFPASTTNNSAVGGYNNQIFAGTSQGNHFVGSVGCIVDSNKNYNKMFATGVYAQNHGGLYLSDNAATGGGYLSASADDQFVARFLNGYIFKTANNVNVMQISSTGAVAIGSSTPAASAILDLQSTTKGALLPKMTTTQQNAISSPATGLLIFNTTTNTLRYYTGSAWADVSAVSTTTDWSTTGNTALTTDYIGTNNNVNLVFARGGLTAGILGTINVALGVGANAFNTGSRTTVIGVESFANGGNDNTGLGYRAGYSQTAGTNNIAIGSNVELPSLTGSNQMNIGNVIYGLAIDGGGVTPAVPAGRIGIGTSAPDASSILHLESTTQGFIMPVMTDAQKVSIASPANGLLVYNTDTKMVENNDSGVWKNKMFQPIISVATAYTPTNQDYTINCVTASFTVTLPACSGSLTGRIFVIKNSSPAGPITVAGSGADLIDGSPTKVMPVIYDSITVQCTGNEWIII